MQIVGERIRGLREGLKLSQAKIAAMIDTTQSNINRYETHKTFPPPSTLVWYADYFNVSLDYIFGRTDDPQGKLYDFKPEALKEQTERNTELREFVEMCFDPNHPMSGKLKETLVRMLQEGIR
jgi:transcriptional regulator with XRE-family HTH domain